MSKAKPVPYEEDLIIAIEQLTEQVQLLGHIIDDFTSELQWRNRNKSSELTRPFALTSLPLDPAARDWEINRFSADDLAPTATPTTPSRPRTLFD